MGSVSVAVPYADRWYFSELLRGATARIEQAGHRAIVHVIPPSDRATLDAADAVEQDFAASDSIGAIVAGFKYRAEQTERAHTWERPIVVVGGSVSGFPSVSIDNVGAALTVTQHLLALGHRRILHIAGPLTNQMDFLVDGRRARGYRTAMESAGLPTEIVEHRFDPAGVYDSIRARLQQADPPTAVFAVSDELAYPVLAAARDLGLRIGRDLSVAGIDDHPDAESQQLTTVRQRPAEIGATATDLLLEGLSHESGANRSRLHPTTFVPRASTGRPERA